MDLDSTLSEFVRARDIRIWGVASAAGFADALPGWHPKDLMPKCESIIVLGHPLLPHSLQMDLGTYVATRSWWDTQRPLSRRIAAWKEELFTLLDGCGLGVASFGVFRVTTRPTFSYRLAQVEAGLAVYGRAGACIHPDYGSYYRVGVLLTEAELAPTSRDHLHGFEPCTGCSECAALCPIGAIDASREPGAGYDRERCARFIFAMSERSGTREYICSQCFSQCPWSMGRLGEGQQNLSV